MARRSGGDATFLFLSWGYRDGDGDGDSYRAMQPCLSQGYLALASRLHAYVAPVGLAWQVALAHRPRVGLWDDDGLHRIYPTL
jgi:hypothetical protein